MSLSPCRVLVVEDDVQLLGFVARVLEHDGITVRSASNGIEALRILAEGRESFDVVILDLVLPWVNGLEVLNALRRSPETRRVPVLITTATIATPQQFARDQPIGILHKPFEDVQLLEAVQALADVAAA